jgi:hypothetical protein
MGRRITERALRKVDCPAGRQLFVTDGVEALELDNILCMAWSFLKPSAADATCVADGH